MRHFLGGVALRRASERIVCLCKRETAPRLHQANARLGGKVSLGALRCRSLPGGFRTTFVTVPAPSDSSARGMRVSGRAESPTL
ncbi:hypothetical protein Sgleb_59880 [Streptomyces glebosus]|uniref:Uncharacterized protein n=1 Tax=Streptomyces glebosus TaxID=249580 RepID=A0A640T609_9ACTN|nr:hypothetical protein Sgleb_59880 [Streptomyces glebosus]